MQDKDDRSQSGQGPFLVLLVDDDPMIHTLIRAGLRNSQYLLVSAMDVIDAKKKIAASKPDMVITDAMMPGSN